MQLNNITHLIHPYFRYALWMIALIITIAISACFPEDENYDPLPIEGNVGEISNSIYSHQTFYSLMNNKESSSNKVSDWDLGFGNGINGNDVILNSGDVLSVYNAGSSDFSLPTKIPSDATWAYDASSGNTDSLAIKDWVNTSTIPYTYSHDVYIIQKNNSPFKKFKLIELSETHYTIVISKLEPFEPDTILIHKGDATNYQKLSLQNENTVIDIEPNTTAWDLQFTTYQTVIPDDDGVPTPYVVRGVLINPIKTQVALYYITEEEVPESDATNTNQEEAELEEFFLKLNMDDIQDLEYSESLDAIGFDWKDVDIDFEAGSAVYKANTRNIYIVSTANGELYKLRFLSYYNASGIKGYPTTHYLLME